ncbi:hypothetical protein [Cesiribacter sp. SM1]|uniref:hypothetical protein n=1 Tax=Cesiribacter sp. SM1 TaxID=2861196 RepID=UPI001CD1CBC1|nr:hypothetical protein [Cesiribacter sp. SM1]
MDSVQRHRITIEQIGIKYGLMLAGANTGFFLLMALFGWEDEIWLRFVNLVFVFLFAYRGMQYFKHHTLNHWTYLKGLSLGMFVVLTGSAIFAVFLAVYGLINQQFITSINEATNISIDFNPVFIAFIAFVETLIYGFIMVFAAMQRLKTTHMQDSVHI